MKNVLFIFFLLTVFWSCQKDTDTDPKGPIRTVVTDPPNVNNYALDSLGICTMIDISPDTYQQQPLGTRILKTEYHSVFPEGVHTDTFIYDENGLISVQKELNNNDREYHFFFEAGKLIEYQTIKSSFNQLLFRDSFSYNTEGNLEKHYFFNINKGPDLPLHYVTEYLYDENEILFASETINVISETPYEYKRYCWENSNLVYYKIYDENGSLMREHSGIFDLKPKYTKFLPKNIQYPGSWGGNNVIESSWIDHVGNYDVTCSNPCISQYTYNEDDLPIRIERESGDFILIYYLD